MLYDAQSTIKHSGRSATVIGESMAAQFLRLHLQAQDKRFLAWAASSTVLDRFGISFRATSFHTNLRILAVV
jgi:hypothetical protein